MDLILINIVQSINMTNVSCKSVTPARHKITKINDLLTLSVQFVADIQVAYQRESRPPPHRLRHYKLML